MNPLDELYNLLHTIKIINEKELDPAFLDCVNNIFKRTLTDLVESTEKYLHNFHDKRPSQTALKKMIDLFPSSLSYKNKKEQLPIQCAMWNLDSMHYIPLLASEGTKHKVGGLNKRGGLLVEGPRSCNRTSSLQLLVTLTDNTQTHEYDLACLEALKGLRKAKLFLKSDVEKYGILSYA